MTDTPSCPSPAPPPVWQPIMPSDDLLPGTVCGIRHLGYPIVFWRDSQGKIHAAEDRCPHKGLRLSLGFVRENDLTCPHHGWRFSGDGHCSLIPAQPDQTPSRSICIRTYPVRDHEGLIWIANFMENGAETVSACNLRFPVKPEEIPITCS